MERVFTWLFVGVVMVAIAVIAFASLSKGVSVAGLSIAALLGLATLVFVLAGRARRTEAEVSMAKSRGFLGLQWVPSPRVRQMVLTAAGVVFYSLALVNWVWHPSAPRAASPGSSTGCMTRSTLSLPAFSSLSSGQCSSLAPDSA